MFALRGQPAPALPNYCRAQATHANAVFPTVGSEKTNNSSRKSVHNRGLRPEACKLAELELQPIELQPIEWHPLSDHAVWNALAIHMRSTCEPQLASMKHAWKNLLDEARGKTNGKVDLISGCHL